MSKDYKYFIRWLAIGIILIIGAKPFAGLESLFYSVPINVFWFKVGGIFALGLVSMAMSFKYMFYIIIDRTEKLKTRRGNASK